MLMNIRWPPVAAATDALLPLRIIQTGLQRPHYAPRHVVEVMRVEAFLKLYKVVLYRSQPEGWVAEVPAISGC